MGWREMTRADVGEATLALEDSADCYGPCERCGVTKPLWLDFTKPGRWHYCKPCWRQILRVVRGRLERKPEQIEEAA